MLAATVVTGGAHIATTGTAGTIASATSKVHIAIKDQGNGQTFKGKMSIQLNYTGAFDSGASRVQPNELGVTIRGGQSQQAVAGYDTFTGRKGKLELTFTGVDLTVPGGKNGLHAEYGTWHLLAGASTGVYKRWTGSGRWAAVTDGTYSIEWDGSVTR